jgi:hypothetical protein
VVATAAGHGVGARAAEVWAGAAARALSLSGGRQRLAAAEGGSQQHGAGETRVETEQNRGYRPGEDSQSRTWTCNQANNNLQQHINTLGGGEIQALRHERPREAN